MLIILINKLGGNIHTIKKNIEVPVVTRRKTGPDKTKYMVIY